MQRLKIQQVSNAFSDGCNMYIEYCRQRNLRDATISHYRQSYRQFYNYFNPDMPQAENSEKRLIPETENAAVWTVKYKSLYFSEEQGDIYRIEFVSHDARTTELFGKKIILFWKRFFDSRI